MGVWVCEVDAPTEALHDAMQSDATSKAVAVAVGEAMEVDAFSSAMEKSRKRPLENGSAPPAKKAKMALITRDTALSTAARTAHKKANQKAVKEAADKKKKEKVEKKAAKKAVKKVARGKDKKKESDDDTSSTYSPSNYS